MSLPAFALARPATLAEAVAALSEDRVPYCGGTELLLAMKAGLLRPDALVDLKRITELRGISREGDQLVIGATTTHAAVASATAVRDSVPVLAEVAARVGNARVRAAGTVGGNLCFAEPRSDLATILIALDATATLAGPEGRRTVAVADLIEGPYSTVRLPDEILVNVAVPVRDGARAAYVKYQPSERPTVGVALVERPDGSARLVIGAAAEMPMPSDHASVGEIDANAVSAELDPIPDLTGSTRYKQHVAAVYVRRAVAALDRGSAS